MSRARGPQLLSVLGLVLVLLGACTLPGGEVPDPGRDPGSGDTVGRASPDPPAPRGRMLLPVPDVAPPGFVDPPPGQGVQRYQDQQLAWTPCRDGRECATVAAPLDWTRPDGQAITLALARIPATQQPRLGTLFINPGGPGGSGVAMTDWFDVAGLRSWDVVGWDPRGTGGSTSVRCMTGPSLDAYYALDISPDDAAEDAALLAAARRFGASCLAGSGSLLEHVSTLDTVRDLDLLRGLVGSERLNLLGFSYGTLLGALYAETFPARVGRLVLDGGTAITDDPIPQVTGFEQVLTDFAAWCAAAETCRLGVDPASVLQAVTDLLTRLDEDPLPVRDRVLTQTLALDGVLYPLYYGAGGYAVLADAVEDARDGGGAPLLELADTMNGRRPDGTYTPDMAALVAIRCLNPDTGVAGARSARAADVAAAPVLGPFWGVGYACAQWPVAAQPALPTIVAAGAPPILVIGTTQDPATPYAWAVGMADQLASGVLLTREGSGHTAYGRGSPCIDRAVQAFLNDGTVPADGTTCS